MLLAGKAKMPSRPGHRGGASVKRKMSSTETAAPGEAVPVKQLGPGPAPGTQPAERKGFSFVSAF